MFLLSFPLFRIYLVNSVCTDAEFQICIRRSGLTRLVPPNGVVSGIERWTDGLKWGPSRVRDDFLYYQEKDADGRDGAYALFTFDPPRW